MLIRYHASITHKALGKAFSQRALESILKANLNQDNLLTGQIGHDEYHYDNNAIRESDQYIEEQRELTQAFVKNENLPAGWAAFGRLLHTGQDFYAHTNYIDLWLSHFSNNRMTPPPPTEIAPLMEELVHNPDLHSGKLYLPWEVLAFVPGLRRLVIPLLPEDSHAHMHLDSPARGKRFAYAFEAAVKRTRYEFDKTVSGMSSRQEALFKDQV